MASIAAFVVFSVASGLAQWYVATLHVSPATAAGQVALVFRVAMPVVIDLASRLYLSIMKVKSLKRYLAEQARDARGDRAGQQKPFAGRAGASLRRIRPNSSMITICTRLVATRAAGHRFAAADYQSHRSDGDGCAHRAHWRGSVGAGASGGRWDG